MTEKRKALVLRTIIIVLTAFVAFAVVYAIVDYVNVIRHSESSATPNVRPEVIFETTNLSNGGVAISRINSEFPYFEHVSGDWELDGGSNGETVTFNNNSPYDLSLKVTKNGVPFMEIPFPRGDTFTMTLK